MESEKDNSPPFLDALVTRKPNGKLGHSVYQKTTYTDRYLNVGFYHHTAQKLLVFNLLVTRVVTLYGSK